MSRKDEIAVAELAAIVGGNLREIDNKMLQKPSTAAENITPHQFIKPRHQGNAQQMTNTKIIPNAAVVEQPKSRPAGSEVVGTENVNVGNLMIPMDGADSKMREAIAAYSQPQNIAPPPPKPTPPPANIAQQSNGAPKGNNTTITDLLIEINDKLDLILKRAKIQPRYKKK